jgi:hypothetical protein
LVKYAMNPEYNLVAYYQQMTPEEKAEKIQDKDV